MAADAARTDGTVSPPGPMHHEDDGCYHRRSPFCQDSSRSRKRNSSVIRPLHINAITSSAAYMFGYAAQPCAQLRVPAEPGFHAHHLSYDQYQRTMPPDP